MSKGFHSDIPFKMGQKVIVLKGSVVKTTHPRRKEYVLKRNQIITIHHILPGCSYCIGLVDSQGNKHPYMTSKDDKYVFESIYGTSDVHVLSNNPDVVIRDRIMFLPISNPAIVWVGTGGYWCEVDINCVKKIENEKSSTP